MSATESDSRNGTVQIREQMLKKLSGIIDHCENRCISGRVKDQSLDEIEKRLEALEHAKSDLIMEGIK